MKDKINVAELLKDCPKGMELDCTIWDSEAKVFLKRVLNDDFAYPIEVTVKYNNTECTKSFTKYGAFNDLSYCKCVIFPKGKTTWEGFMPPCKFKNGDIAASNDGLFIGIVKYADADEDYIYTYCAINKVGNLTKNFPYYLHRLATEEEKAKLFDAIKTNGYKWNSETKTLEKLPKFKVGDRIVHKENRKTPFVITEITKQSYKGGTQFEVLIEQQDNFELVPNKFDINTLVPFESRVLVRDSNKKWRPAIYGFCDKFETRCAFYVVGGCVFEQCIPYEGNEHLRGKIHDCDEYFKTWK